MLKYIILFITISASAADQATIELIKKLEGKHIVNGRHVVYTCQAGKKTIGYGCTSEAIVAKGSITEEEAVKYLTKIVNDLEIFVDKTVAIELTANQKSALVSFAYNVGKTNFKRSTLVKCLNAGAYADVPKQMMKWKYVTIEGKLVKSQGLINRRKSEIAVWNQE